MAVFGFRFQYVSKTHSCRLRSLLLQRYPPDFHLRGPMYTYYLSIIHLEARCYWVRGGYGPAQPLLYVDTVFVLSTGQIIIVPSFVGNPFHFSPTVDSFLPQGEFCLNCGSLPTNHILPRSCVNKIYTYFPLNIGISLQYC